MKHVSALVFCLSLFNLYPAITRQFSRRKIFLDKKNKSMIFSLKSFKQYRPLSEFKPVNSAFCIESTFFDIVNFSFFYKTIAF